MDWKFKEDVEPQGSSNGFWYDICNGYIEPEKLLADNTQLISLNVALKLVESFERALEKAELLNEF